MEPVGSGLKILCVLGALLVGCTVPNPNYDPGAGGELGPADSDGSLMLVDGGLTPVDAPVTPAPPDKGLPKPDQPVKPAAPPFGKICSKQAECASGEICLFTDQSSKGICLRKCSTLDKPCSVPNPKYYSGCSLYWNADVGKIKVCVIFCKGPSASYPCPNATQYRCKVFDNGLGMCVPK